jgi:hypothetical protein
MRIVTVTAIGLLLTTQPTQAAPLRCPETVAVDQHVGTLPPGMKAFDSEARHTWTNAQFSEGPPDRQVWLAPDNSRTSGKTVTNLWTFAPSGDGIWLSCGYTGTSLVPSFRLADSIRTCSVKYDANTAPLSATAIDCR